MRSFFVSLVIILITSFFVKGQFAPPAGQPGSTAIYKDSTIVVNWATYCEVSRGWMNIADTSLGKADVGDSSMACGPAGTNGVVSLGDGGSATLTFDYPITNGPSWDFAVFENSFSDTFLELGFVEVSSNGTNYYRFPATSLTDTSVQVTAFGSVDATKINNLAGKYRALFGTPFDLDELSGQSGLDVNHITHVRIIDVVGSIDKQYASYDFYGHAINDPFPTPFNSSGVDLDAVGVIHQDMSSVKENDGSISINIYPNPCSSHVYVSPANIGMITLLDVNRRILKEITAIEEISLIDMGSFRPGVYFLKIIGDKGIVYHKIIKT
jgi:hypothetical protein